MKTPVVVVAVTLAVATLVAATLLIATGTRGENARGSLTGRPAARSSAPKGHEDPALPSIPRANTR